MKSLIVYDSYFGNTEKVAQEIGNSLGSQKEVAVCREKEVTAEHWKDLNLLVVGSPTRAFSPSPAIKKFLKSIPKNNLKGIRVAAFDTRISEEEVDSKLLSFLVKLFGYAAKPILQKMVKKGGEPAPVSPEGFMVQDTEGPLREDELQRAAEWGKQIKEA
ncbi:MAG: flavodoxin family protein [bacterium]